MNETMKNICQRRSIRKYKDQPLPKEILDEVIKAGFYAPSAINAQPRHFWIVDDKEMIQDIMDIQGHCKFLEQAKTAILVCGDLEISEQFWIDDCAAATENILIAAQSFGLGTCWCGLCHTEAAWNLVVNFNLPEHIRPYSLIAIGYPDEEKPMPDRVDPARIHHNEW